VHRRGNLPDLLAPCHRPGHRSRVRRNDARPAVLRVRRRAGGGT
jgi:hypothetical protein